MLLRIAALTIGLMACAAPVQARVLTDLEASRLTFDALTAAPRPVFRPLYRRYTHRIMATRRLSHRQSHHGRRSRS